MSDPLPGPGSKFAAKALATVMLFGNDMAGSCMRKAMASVQGELVYVTVGIPKCMAEACVADGIEPGEAVLDNFLTMNIWPVRAKKDDPPGRDLHDYLLRLIAAADKELDKLLQKKGVQL